MTDRSPAAIGLMRHRVAEHDQCIEIGDLTIAPPVGRADAAVAQ